MSRPSSTPVTMDAKLSSSSIMSAACLETSEPAIPMATPISAFFRAGESLTPSPSKGVYINYIYNLQPKIIYVFKKNYAGFLIFRHVPISFMCGDK